MCCKLQVTSYRLHVTGYKNFMPKRQLIGKVISDKMQKTVVVRVEQVKEHPKYKRRFNVHKKYKAHDQKGEYKIGDKIIIQECRPLSKEKKWRAVKKLESGIMNQES